MNKIICTLTMFFVLGQFTHIQANDLYGLAPLGGESVETSSFYSESGVTWKFHDDDNTVPEGYALRCDANGCTLVPIANTTVTVSKPMSSMGSSPEKTSGSVGSYGLRSLSSSSTGYRSTRSVTRSTGSTGTRSVNTGSVGTQYRTVTRYRTELRQVACPTCPGGFKSVQVSVPYQVRVPVSSASNTVTRARTVTRSSSTVPNNYQARWTWPGNLSSHLSSTHGIDTSGMSRAEMMALHDQLHEGGGHIETGWSRSVTTNFARPRFFRPRSWFPRLRNWFGR